MERDPHRLDELIAFNYFAAVMHLESREGVGPYIFAEDCHGACFYFRLQISPDAQYEAVMALKPVFFAYDVKRYVFVAEAWFSDHFKEDPDMKKKLDATVERMKRRGASNGEIVTELRRLMGDYVPPSQDLNREEMLHIVAADGQGCECVIYRVSPQPDGSFDPLDHDPLMDSRVGGEGGISLWGELLARPDLPGSDPELDKYKSRLRLEFDRIPSFKMIPIHEQPLFKRGRANEITDA